MAIRTLLSTRYDLVAGVMRKDTIYTAIRGLQHSVNHIIKIKEEVTNCIIEVDMHMVGMMNDWFKIGVKTNDSLANGPVIGIERGDGLFYLEKCVDPPCEGAICGKGEGYMYGVTMKDSQGNGIGHYQVRLYSCHSPPLDRHYRITLKINGSIIEYKYEFYTEGFWTDIFEDSFTDNNIPSSGYIYLFTRHESPAENAEVKIYNIKILKEEAKSISWST